MVSPNEGHNALNTSAIEKDSVGLNYQTSTHNYTVGVNLIKLADPNYPVGVLVGLVMVIWRSSVVIMHVFGSDILEYCSVN